MVLLQVNIVGFVHENIKLFIGQREELFTIKPVGNAVAELYQSDGALINQE